MPDAFRMVALSRALLSMGLLPSLAFSPAELLTYLKVEEFSVLVLHMAIVDLTLRAGLGRGRASSQAPVLYVGSSLRPAAAAGDLGSGGHVADGSPPDAIAAMAVSLATQAAAPATQVLRWGPLRMDLGRREAWWAARRLVLTSMQFRLLATLARAEGGVVPALELSRRAFGSAVAHDQERVQAHVRRIRKRIEADPSHPRFLVTVRGEGFRLAGAPPGYQDPGQVRW